MRWGRLSEFKPTILFLGKFLGLYLILNVLYGLYVSSYQPRPDPVTNMVTVHTSGVLKVLDHPATILDQEKRPSTTLYHNHRAIVSVYEGCSGLNIAIIFVSFLFAFGPYTRQMLWFVPLGLIIIHLFNLVRIAGLFLITIHKPAWTYFLHKYLFTAFIYAVVFSLWFWWVNRFTATKRHATE